MNSLNSVNSEKFIYKEGKDCKESTKNKENKEFKEEKREKIKFSIYDLQKTDLLGIGVSGSVFLLQHKLSKKKLALKVIHFKNDEKMKNLIEAEIKALHECKSENIIKCYASYFNEGAINIVLEYMNRGTLSDVLKKVKKVPEEILGIISYQILKGLEYLHKVKKIVHRDIKPSNILINSKGLVKISDFGVSSVLKDSLDCRNTLVGTFIYMSPERVTAQSYSANSDVWSVGMSILECALGYSPYMIYNDFKMINDYWHLSNLIRENPVPKAPEGEFSLEFCNFISVMLNKDPSERPSAASLLNHPFILQYVNESPVVFAKWMERYMDSSEEKVNLRDKENEKEGK